MRSYKVGQQRPLVGLDLEALDEITLLDILVVLEGHAAFLAGWHLFDIVLEALEYRQRTLVDDHLVAQQANLGATLDPAVGDLTAGGREMKRLEGNIAGAGSLDLGEGSAKALTLNIAGSGDIQGGNLKGQEVEVNIAGSGDVEVRAQDLLKVGIAGSGSVSYWGAPRLRSEIAGSGDVSRVGS